MFDPNEFDDHGNEREDNEMFRFDGLRLSEYLEKLDEEAGRGEGEA